METSSRVSNTIPATIHHLPVMVEETLAFLHPEEGGDFLDGTVGSGGHAAALLQRTSPRGRLLGIDRDRAALTATAVRLADFGDRVVLRQGNFSEARSILAEVGWTAVDGVLLDLGFSSLQIEDAERGFSFSRSGPLDMRMDQREECRAVDVINRASETEIREILQQFGEEPAARAIAKAVVRTREEEPILTTAALALTIERVVKRTPTSHLHPATRAFQALRIAVNRELDHLRRFLHDAYRLLKPGGRMVILSYHSLEDRLVKEAFRRWAARCLCPPQLHVCRCGWLPQGRILTKKPVTPTGEEVARNPRARSARLRAVERCTGDGQL
jgi:16S rRNA (cytosine1402-N4)-methyltransferase